MEVEILHPDGDVILVVGKDEEIQKYRVSSAFLSHASPVFTAMFAKDRFAEGQNLSSANPKEVRLPDDDPDSIGKYVADRSPSGAEVLNRWFVERLLGCLFTAAL